MVKVGDRIRYKSWNDLYYEVEVIEVDERKARCSHLHPEHIGRQFVWFFDPGWVTTGEKSASDMHRWIEEGKAEVLRPIIWEV